MLTVSICIANFKQDHLLPELIASIDMQDYPLIEKCIYNDTEGVGSGEAFNRAIAVAKGDIIVLMCADDVLTDARVISDIVEKFETHPGIAHVSRFYHQFIDGDRRPVRAWRQIDMIELANNPSGLAFRADIIKGLKLSNKMFVEAPTLVKEVLNKGYGCGVIRYDTVAVRIHNSTARNKDYYLKRWTSSPIEEWVKLGGKSLLSDFTSLIQIKNYFTLEAVLKECFNFVKYKPINIINPAFLFFATVAILTPRVLLRRVPDVYRRTIGRLTTKEIKRP